MRRLIPGLLLLLSAPCQAEQAALLVYDVQEQGAPPYISRYLITKTAVRIDEGAQSNAGYTIYDRISKRLYNVDPEERTVLELVPPPLQPEAPKTMALKQSLAIVKDAPPVGDVQLRKLSLLVDGKICRELMVAQGLMPQAVAGLIEFRRSLARLQYPGLERHDAGLSDCQKVEWVYAPARHLQQGLPISDTMAGKRQLLLDYQADFSAPQGSFEVPEDYQRINPPALLD